MKYNLLTNIAGTQDKLGTRVAAQSCGTSREICLWTTSTGRRDHAQDIFRVRCKSALAK